MTAAPGTTNRGASVDETLVLLAANICPLDTQPMSLGEAGGRVLREPVRAPEDQPPFDRSSVDGYAVRLDDDSSRFCVVDFVRAGEWKPRQLQRGQAVQIATGGALPGDDLQVVMKEDVRVDGTEIALLRRELERNIRFAGEDARAGSVLISEGTILSPGALALLASVGCVRPLVTRQPRVLHVATGNEIVPPDQAPQRGQIRDSNSTLVRAFFSQWRVEPAQLHVPEDEAQARSGIRHPASGIEQCDLLLISGGASVGEHDFTRHLLEELGYTIHVSRTTARPGKPLILATRGAAVAFGLPGNPLAHFVCLNLYVRVALMALLGFPPRPVFTRGVLAQDFQAKASSRETLCPARLALVNAGVELTPLPWRSSGDLTALATANALVRVPSGCGTMARGAAIEFVSTAPFA